MKNLITTAFVFFLAISGFSQENPGIQFARKLTWEQIKAKAKAENKFIFVDVFTTSCGPCKKMANEVFPVKEVGEFYNAHFINIGVQLDSTKKDDLDTRAWYTDAKKIKKEYDIKAFPTLLYINPHGELVHRIIGGLSAEQLISAGKDALDPEKQFFTLKKRYESGDRSAEILNKLVSSAIAARENDFVPEVVNEYLKSRTDLSEPDIIKLLPHVVDGSTHPGFAVLMKNSATADSIFGKGTTDQILKSAILKGDIIPKLRTGKTEQTGRFTSEVRKNVDWIAIENLLNEKFPQFAVELLFESKKMHYEWSRDFRKLSLLLDEYFSKKSEVNKNELNQYAWMIFEKSSDPKALNTALSWSQKTLEGKTSKKIMYMDTYANLLYKLGRRDEAIKLEKEVVQLSGETNGELSRVLNKMIRGEKTW